MSWNPLLLCIWFFWVSFWFCCCQRLLEMKISSFSNGLKRVGISYTFDIECNTAISPHALDSVLMGMIFFLIINKIVNLFITLKFKFSLLKNKLIIKLVLDILVILIMNFRASSAGFWNYVFYILLPFLINTFTPCFIEPAWPYLKLSL